MNNVTAIVSMLHESATINSATRMFRQSPVLAWTLQRLNRSQQLGTIAMICWEDQVDDVAPLAREYESDILCKGPRSNIAAVESVAAARRWADGWRGGLLYTCDFDLGFYAPWVMEVIETLASDAVILVDPSAGMVDAQILDQVIEYSRQHPNIELCFTPAAPGLAGALLRPAMVQRLAGAKTHPGRILHYLPDAPMRDPIGGDGCVAVPMSVARSTRNYRLDSDRQINRLTEAAVELNGELVSSEAEQIVNRLNWTSEVDPLPREIVIELNTNRATVPIFWPGKFQAIQRPPMTRELARRMFEQIGPASDIRLTFAGVGDPLLHSELFDFIQIAKENGIAAIHVETDLLPADANAVKRLAESPVDVVSVHLPAMSATTYAAIMGVDRYAQILENIKQFILTRQQRHRGVPILVPLFTKCQANLAEMETWYDQWLKALGAAVINGPSDFAAMIPDCGVADMSPPKRKPCSRLWSRMTILSDGRVASCEQDVLGRQVVGNVLTESIGDIWQRGMNAMRLAHKQNDLSACALCKACREWHRP